MSNCNSEHTLCNCNSSATSQTLDELDFERGIWSAAQYGDIERVKLLVESKKCPVDIKDSAGYTALHYAARNGHLKVCEYLVRNGADVNASTRSGCATPLHRASATGKTDIVRYLIENKANANLQDSDGKTALHKSVENKHWDVTELLLNHNPELKIIADRKGYKPFDH